MSVPDEVTPAQHAYLVAFDRFLRSPTGEERDSAGLAMSVLLDLMREDARVGQTGARQRKSLHVRWHVRRGLVKDGCVFCEAMLREAA